MAVAYHTHQFSIPTATNAEIAAGVVTDKVATPAALGSAAAADASAFLQPGDIGTDVQAHSANLDEVAAVNPGATGLAILADATVDDVYTSLTTALWTSGVNRTMKEREKRVAHIVDFCTPHETNESTAAIIEWARQGQEARVRMQIGGNGNGASDFITEEEIEITQPGQVIEWLEPGGYAYRPNDDFNWETPYVKGTRLVAGGTAFAAAGKRVRTRRLFRGSAGDPQDAALSAVLNIQAEGVQIIRPAIHLPFDITDTSPTNMGDDVDVAIFIGSVVGVQIHDAQIIGYFRRAGIYADFSGQSNLARCLNKAGVAYANQSVQSGSDGLHMFNPTIMGPRVGFAALGALPKAGATDYGDPYYDQQLGATVADARGSFGNSDMLIVGGRIYGPDHHSWWRRADPTPSGGVLNQTSLLAEPDNMPAAMHLSGLAGNTSGKGWGHRFMGTRFATWEAFRVRRDYTSRDTFIGSHIEGRGNASIRNASGTLLGGSNSNDYVLNSYGDVTGTARSVGLTVIDSVRTDFESAYGVHHYGTEVYFQSKSGLVQTSQAFQTAAGAHYGTVGQDVDYRAPTGFLHRWRTNGNVTAATMSGTAFTMYAGMYIEATAGNDLDLRAPSSQKVRFRVSGSTVGTFDATELMVAGKKITFGTAAADFKIFSGTGSPEGVVTAGVNAVYFNETAASVATWMYRKNSGTGNTGWVAATN